MVDRISTRILQSEITHIHRRRTIILCLFILVSHTGFTQPKDTLHFFNGSMVIGELNKIKLGYIEFDGDNVGIIRIKNNKISAVIAQSNYFRIETTDRTQHQGYLLRGSVPGNVMIRGVNEDVDLDLESITSLANYGQSWKTRFSGNFNAGYTYTKSSRLGRLNMDGTVYYKSARSEMQLSANTILSSDSIETKRERENLSISYNYSFTHLWIAAAAARYERNLELGLQRRWQQVLTVGQKLLVRRNQQGLLLVGVATNQELNLEGESTESTEGVIYGNYTLFSFEKPKITLSVTETVYLSITQKDRVRFDGDINLNWEFIDDFTINLQFYHNFDSQSPGTGEANVDVGFVVGLGLKF
jgi:hypothetical protein